MICCVLGANPPYEVIAGFINRIWKDFSIDKILLVKKGLFLVRFNELQDAMTVAHKGFYHFDNKPFIVKAWNPELDINVDAISALPIWVRLPELDIKYWGLQSLSKIGSMLGIPLKTDKYTKEKLMLKYARLLVEMPLDGEFPEYIDFANEKNVVIRQKVIYEWKPIKCSYCKMYGHIQEECRKRSPQRKEWRAVEAHQKTASKEDENAPVEGDADGFQIATRHTTRQTAPPGFDKASETLLQVNHYNVLMEGGTQECVEGRGTGERFLTPHG